MTAIKKLMTAIKSYVIASLKLMTAVMSEITAIMSEMMTSTKLMTSIMSFVIAILQHITPVFESHDRELESHDRWHEEPPNVVPGRAPQ